MKKKNIALYYRLLRLCVFILLPVFLVSLGFSQYAILTTQREQSQSVLANLESNMSKMENDLEHVYLSLLDMRENKLEIKWIARRYPDRLSSYEFGVFMDEIIDQMTRLSMNYDLVSTMTLYWPGIHRATSLSKSYSDSFTEEYLHFIEKAMEHPDGMITEGPFGTIELYTVGATLSPYRIESVLHTTIDSEALLSKVEPAANGAITVLFGDTWYAKAEDDTTVFVSAYQKALQAETDTSNQDDMEDIYKSILQAGKSKGYFSIGSYLCCYIRSERSHMIACNLMPINTLKRSTRVYQLFLCIIVDVTIGMLILARQSLNHSINKPIIALIKLFKEGEKQPDAAVPQENDGELGMVYESYLQMRNNLNLSQQHVLEQRLALERAEYHLLQAQISPHFLHNCFNIIQHCLRNEDIDTAISMVNYLSTYFRCLSRSISENSRLEDEWTYVDTYLKIQKIRFGRKLKYEVEQLPDGMKDLLLPRLSLQSLVENVFKHSVNRKADCKELKIYARHENGCYSIGVWDNGDNMTESDIDRLRSTVYTEEMGSEHIGLANIRRRLKLMGKENELFFRLNPSGGFIVEIQIKETAGGNQ